MEPPVELKGEGERRPHASRRLGDDYQDIVGVGFLLELVTRPDECVSVRFEQDGVGALDDVVVERRDRWEYVQVKYAVDNGQTWSVDDLTVPARANGTSLLRKWADAWNAIRARGGQYVIRVLTNRVPDAGLASLLESNRRGFAAARFHSDRDAAATAVMNATGLPEDQSALFLRELRFSFGQPMLEALRRDTQAGFGRIKAYADTYLEHDSSNLIVSAFFNGECGCSGGANGTYAITYTQVGGGSGYNTYVGNTSYNTGWATQVIIDQPDTGWTTKYIDETGQLLSTTLTNADPATAFTKEISTVSEG